MNTKITFKNSKWIETDYIVTGIGYDFEDFIKDNSDILNANYFIICDGKEYPKYDLRIIDNSVYQIYDNEYDKIVEEYIVISEEKTKENLQGL